KDKSFVKQGLSKQRLVLKSGETLGPAGSVRVTAETQGPWSARLRVEGTYAHTYTFVTYLTFVSSKSWFLVDHKIVSGDLRQIQAVQLGFHFDLPLGPLSSATGARMCQNGMATFWTVMTDGSHTVDIAILDAWTPAGAVRCEVDSEGRFLAIYPSHNRSCRMYVHVLHGPPDDITNTPAPTMAAALFAFSNSKVTAS
ncbi:MAG: hypothetical protein O3B73_06040, partial [bacterium]|nr:hypothetical protein [bacterium]